MNASEIRVLWYNSTVMREEAVYRTEGGKSIGNSFEHCHFKYFQLEKFQVDPSDRLSFPLEFRNRMWY